jgi:hypothetical protein
MITISSSAQSATRSRDYAPRVFKQEVPTLKLSVEQGTTNVPADGQYHVLQTGALLFSSKSKKNAVAVYEQRKTALFELHGRPERPKFDREQWLIEQRTSYDIRAMRSDWLRTYGAIVKRGGKGGRGGV